MCKPKRLSKINTSNGLSKFRQETQRIDAKKQMHLCCDIMAFHLSWQHFPNSLIISRAKGADDFNQHLISEAPLRNLNRTKNSLSTLICNDPK